MDRCSLEFCAAWEHREWSHWMDGDIFCYMARVDKKYFLGYDPVAQKAFDYANDMSDKYLKEQRSKRSE